jgi:hypothetical protein
MAAFARRHPILVLTAVVGLLAACGPTPTPAPGSPSGSPSASASTTATPQPTALSERETAALAAELAPVAGFDYRDIPVAELATYLDSLPSEISAASYHTVVDATTGEEAVFLALYVLPPGDAMNSAAYAKRVATSTLETSSPTALTLSGQQVWYAEKPENPKSRYTYTWLRHGTQGWADGPDRAALEQFLAGYFGSGFRGAESTLLSRQLVDVPGFSYTNAVDRSRELAAIPDALPGATASMHYVFDATHTFGGLILAGPVMAGTSDVAAATAWFTRVYDGDAYNVKPLADRTISGIAVHPLKDNDSGMTIFVWTWSGAKVTGWLLTSRPDIATTFLTRFLAASPQS